ncbi:hypothetical protein [Halomonas sp. KO116]|uniref:hypothetical protein n=1 Tax=Halomonas sp. KO116 TaxID=1504981 RepID=UPI0004E2C4F3|nr:hypothetical protein [Halomonas sp. KO116]AJY52092.1 hypothetical protein KO116_03625 [Halomonas sp. KO116]
MKTCYMCEKAAVSSEHVPPKCLFPQSKDIKGPNLRLHLITVPSCDIHNSAKSKDDEFLMVALAGIFGNNSIGYQHKFTKVNRAIKRSANRLLDAAFTKRKHYLLERDNDYLEIIWGTFDHLRLQECFTHIAYGLYFHHFQRRFEGQTKVLMGYLHSSDASNNTFVQFIKSRAAIDLKEVEKNGDNPDVFYYQFVDPDEHGIFMLHMRFYGGIDIYVSFLPEGKPKPFNLAIELMNAGIETVIDLDGNEYRVNSKS